MLVELITAFIWLFYFRETVDILIVSGYILDVCTCPAYGQRFDYPIPNALCQFLKWETLKSGSFLRRLNSLIRGEKKGCQVPDSVYRAVSRVLEQLYLVV